MSTTVKVKVKPVSKILKDHGLEKDGPVQDYWTSIVNKRITRYMPFKSGVLATKLKFQASPSSIIVLGPYANYQYRGKVMVNANTGEGTAFIPGVGYRYKKGTVPKDTNRPLRYDKSKNPDAGPLWDERLVENEMDAMIADLKNYIRRKEGQT